ncbi:hypothetical protein HMPREF1991_02271 [Hoylesella loescheii DSM 19665 = JCM 12249 = ATCC 15930]|uniref:Uncharacterized protein n=1 Tax=Hoylesella loescheii DSM 19665 = JCM 12249 = ATCC 15930 TaxID=1122985 RepID=A0A069QPB9_HOYLO|nr:hypothetical protein HMPREF1991_02271 [Hoylesella loescheii DSM 19665 = JCM 12249 = ATCC 15930]
MFRNDALLGMQSEDEKLPLFGRTMCLRESIIWPLMNIQQVGRALTMLKNVRKYYKSRLRVVVILPVLDAGSQPSDAK